MSEMECTMYMHVCIRKAGWLIINEQYPLKTNNQVALWCIGLYNTMYIGSWCTRNEPQQWINTD